MYNDYEREEIIDTAMDIFDNTDATLEEALGIALESMVYDMADYLYNQCGYSENEALETANVYYGGALETSSQIKQMKKTARIYDREAARSMKRGEPERAYVYKNAANDYLKRVKDKKDAVDRAVASQHERAYHDSIPPIALSAIRGSKAKPVGTYRDGSPKYYMNSEAKGYIENMDRGDRSDYRISRRNKSGMKGI